MPARYTVGVNLQLLQRQIIGSGPTVQHNDRSAPLLDQVVGKRRSHLDALKEPRVAKCRVPAQHVAEPLGYRGRRSAPGGRRNANRTERQRGQVEWLAEPQGHRGPVAELVLFFELPRPNLSDGSFRIIL